ncbi:MAG: glycosyltransferase, partial [Anaerolineales bacterium]|nr:glycosyltransferase [Anaerolineales bacterium]
SNSLLEAMASGLACVATRVGGSTEVLGRGEYGLLVEPGNVEELTAALVRLGSSREERSRLGDTARRVMVEKYDFQVVGRQYHELYLRLLGKA